MRSLEFVVHVNISATGVRNAQNVAARIANVLVTSQLCIKPLCVKPFSLS